MKTSHRRPRSSQRRRGQGMTEYVIIVGLIAMTVLGAVAKFGGVLDKKFKGQAKTLENKVTANIK